MQKLEIKILPLYLISMAMLILCWFLFGLSYEVKWESQKIDLTENCVMQIGNTVYKDSPVGDISFTAPKKFERIKITIPLPEYADCDWSVGIITYLCAVEAYVDGETIYSFGRQDIRKNKMAGSGYHFISLPKNCGGKLLTLFITASEGNSQTNIATPFIVKTENKSYVITQGLLPEIFISSFFVVFGICLFIISLFRISTKQIYSPIFALSLLLISVGIWAVSSTKVMQLFTNNLKLLTTLEYTALYFSPIPISLIANNFRTEVRGYKTRGFINVFLVISMGFYIISTVLHFTNILHYPVLLVHFQVMSLIEICTTIFIAVFNSNSNLSNPYRMLLTSFITIVSTILLDLIRFNLQKYFFQHNEFLLTSFFIIGLLIFMLQIFSSITLMLYEKFQMKTRNEEFEYYAYHDALTSFYNTRKWMEVMDELNGCEEPYAIISMDLNGLKKINDTKGHENGNSYIQNFSGIVRKSFSELGDIFRTGGDEFTVCIRNPSESILNECFIKFEERQRNSNVEPIGSISSSYGIAYSTEIYGNITADKVFNLADERMYEMKEKFHRLNGR